MRRCAIAGALAFLLAAAPVWAAEPVVTLWYRGTPAGTPRLDDLAAIKAAGFHAVTWPFGDPTAVAAVSKFAEAVGLAVVIEPEGASVSRLDGRITIDVAHTEAREIPALAWRAIAAGTRTISFDPGSRQGAGLDRPDGRRHDWVPPALAVARQLSANAALIDELRRASPPVFLSARPLALDVQLLEGARAWVIIATNTGRTRVDADMALPKGVPYAIWVSLIDATTLAMVDRPDGARWRIRLDAGNAAVYLIDKILK
jgi:hypothetical protein